MTAQNDNKIQEFQDAGVAIISAAASLASKPTEESLQHVFSVAHDAGTMRKQTDLVQQVWSGLVDPSQLSIRVGGAEMVRLMEQVRETKAKQSRDTQMLLAMLDDMERIANDIDAANERIQEGLDALKEEYGDDYVQIVAGSVLTDEEIAGCETEDDILILMAEKAFDEDGNLRPGFEHLDPRMIKVLREVHDREELRAEGAKLVDDYVANGGEMTPELEERAETFGVDASFKNRLELEREAGASDLVETANNARIDEYTRSGGLDLSDL